MTVNVAPTPPVVNVQNVTLATNKRGMVTQLDVAFSGPVNATQADKTKIYRLAYPNRARGCSRRQRGCSRLRSAKYNTATDSVTLTLSKPLALKARALDLVIDGTSPSGLEDVVGRYLDGADNGQHGEQCGCLDLQEWRQHRVKCGRISPILSLVPHLLQRCMDWC